MQIIKKILYLLTVAERKRALLLIVMMLFTGLADMIGVASILPFLAVLTNPSLIETNILLNNIFNYTSILGIQTIQQFIFFLGTSVFLLFIISLSLKIITTYLQTIFVQMREYSISKRLLESYLHQPYSWFLYRNSADLGKSILSEVQIVINQGLRPAMYLISNIIVAVALLFLLMITDYKLTLTVGLTFSILFGLIFKFTNNYLNQIGKERLKANKLRFTAASEAFGDLRVTKVSRLEQIYVDRFAKPTKILSMNQAHSQVVGLLPRYILEGITFGGLLLVTLYLMTKSQTFVDVIPIIALYSFAGYRLMPAIQQIYLSITQLRFVGPAVDTLHNDIKNLKSFNLNQNQNENQNLLQLEKTINLNQVSYCYPNSSRKILKNINLSIPAKSTVGLVGATGSGKTTIIDIITGLLEPTQGSLVIDEEIITVSNCKSWQRSIGYVPQSIFLSDDTIEANIAFGVEPKDIDQKAVVKAAKIANFHNFVIDELPNKYETTVGERGVRLSGGQRQRIGIARALYHNPQVLILDEATSALDNFTEKAIVSSLNDLNKNITIILIAHRLSTVQKCDNIFVLDNGELKAQGKFDELLLSSETFKKLTK